MSNDSVRRIMAEVKEFNKLNKSASTFFYAAPLESDLFEWHFSVRGPPDTAFADGVYHGRIVLPAEYPLKPPEIILLTPNGRFEVGKRICLSVTAHHQETWRPSWGIRTILTALVGFMPSKAEGVGALDYPDSDRRRLARLSWSFRCKLCGVRPIEQLYVPAAVEAGFPGAFVPPAGTPSAAAPSNAAAALPSASQSQTVPAASNSESEKVLKTSSAKPPEPTLSCCSNGCCESKAEASSSTSSSISSVSERAEGNSKDTTTDSSASLPPATTPPNPSRNTNDVVHVQTSTAYSNNSTEAAAPVQPNQIASRNAPSRQTEVTQPSESQPITTTTSSPRSVSAHKVQEPELFYLACAIIVTVLAIVFRRLYVVLTTF